MLILCALLVSIVHSLDIPQFAAIQDINEVYFSYLPYIRSCDYNQSDILAGQVQIQLLDGKSFFAQIQYDNDLTFWSPVHNGLNIMMSLSSEQTEYEGSIYYNSPIHGFNRQIIFYEISGNNRNLTFYYSLTTLVISNMTVNITVQNVKQIQLSEECGDILEGCQNITSNNFGFIGNGSFIFVCGSVGGFIFDVESGYDQVLDLSKLGQGEYTVVSNPAIINDLFHINDYHWNCLINSQKGPISKNYFFMYDFQTKNYTITSMKVMEPEIKILINRLWGLQLKKQIAKWMQIVTKLKNSIYFKNSEFPGQVVSVYVSDYDNIFIESQDNDINYLNVFDSNGELVWNISYSGTIVYYSNKGVYIYDKSLNQLFKVSVQRPIFKIKPPKKAQPQDQFNTSLSLTCFNTTVINFNYSLIVTSSLYPTGFIKTSEIQQSIYTTDTVVGFRVEDRFLIVGPDYEVIVNSPPNIQVVIIDSSTITIKTKAVAIVSVELQYGTFASIIFATSYGIYSINSRQRIQTLSTEPCGFDAIQTVIKQDGSNSFLITNGNGQQCVCSQAFSECSLISQSEMIGLMNSGTRPYMNMIANNNNNGVLQIQGSTANIKKNLYSLLHQGYIISILTNNTVLVFDVNTKKVMSYIIVLCLTTNSVNGQVYSRQFFDPFLILYCQGSSYLFQYVLREFTLLYQRNIPLYKFRIKSGDNAINVGFSSVFLAVDPTLDVYPKPINCCVLRINPCTYTVSAITQIVQTSSIILVTRYKNVDIALFGTKSKGSQQCIIKAYFPSIWITLSQQDNDTVNQNSTIVIFFESRRYNFAAAFELFVTFDLSSVNLTKNSSMINTINLNQSDQNPILIGNASYNFNDLICGPVFEFYFNRKSDNMSNVEIIHNGVLTRSKILGSIGIEFIQIINPLSFAMQDCTLNQLILVVSVDAMYVYNKYLNNVQMLYIGEYQLPEKRCTYYFYSAINTTSASLTSNCEGFNYDYQFPLLTLNYDENFTLTYTWTINPLNLREIYTIVRGNNETTLVLGILQGPMNSATGKLYICEGNICSALYISTKMMFLINYAADKNGNDYIVMSIDYYYVQVYLNPLPNSNVSSIKSNFTFNYSKFIDEDYCSVIKIVSFTNTTAFCVLSCQKYYYSITFNFVTGNVEKEIIRFARYSQCNLEDEFKPNIVQDTEGNIEVMLVTCKQNDYMFKLQTYQTINSSTPVIYTGYLQVFMINGPQGPKCQPNTVSPIKIVPLSTEMNYPLFTTYTVNGQNKFIYSQINGILIDNFVSTNLSIEIIYQPLSLEISFPQISLYIVNPYYHLSYQIQTSSLSVYSINTITKITFGAFVLANLVTLVCLCCFCVRNKKKKNSLGLLDMRQSNGTTGGNELHYDDNVRNAFERMSRQRQVSLNMNTNMNKRVSNRPSEIEMYFVKKN